MAEVFAGLILLALIVATVTAFVTWRGERTRRRAVARRYSGRWEPVESVVSGYTVVGVRRIIDGRQTDYGEVTRVAMADPEWSDKVRTARAEAAQRISDLEAGA